MGAYWAHRLHLEGSYNARNASVPRHDVFHSIMINSHCPGRTGVSASSNRVSVLHIRHVTAHGAPAVCALNPKVSQGATPHCAPHMASVNRKIEPGHPAEKNGKSCGRGLRSASPEASQHCTVIAITVLGSTHISWSWRMGVPLSIMVVVQQ